MYPDKPKRVLVIGSSTGYGISSRISAAFSCGADTLGVYFERPPSGERTASAGYYNSQAFCKLAREEGLKAEDINGDAFSNEIKEEVIAKAKEFGGKFDLVIYSLASPRRTDPQSGDTYRACLKPIGTIYKNKTLDTDRKQVKELTINPANADEIAQTETYDEESLHMRQLLKTKLIDMDLSVRALNCLKAAEVDTLGDLVSYNKNDLMKFRNFGKKSLTELEELVVLKGLSFGMDLSKYKLDKD